MRIPGEYQRVLRSKYEKEILLEGNLQMKDLTSFREE